MTHRAMGAKPAKTQLQQRLRELGYTLEWLEGGVIDAGYLEWQLVDFAESQDKHQEHYRARAFVDFLKTRRRVSNDQLDQILSLRDDGADGVNLAANRAINLIASGVLSDVQFKRMKTAKIVEGDDAVAKIYRRFEALRDIDAHGLFEEAIKRAKASNDTWVHEAVLEHGEVTAELLDWLARCGASKRIRSMARAKRQTKRFRSA